MSLYEELSFIEESDEHDFLSGPYSDAEDVVIDPIFAKTVEGILIDNFGSVDAFWDALRDHDTRSYSITNNRYIVFDNEEGDFYLMKGSPDAPEGLIGAFVNPDVAVDPKYQGQGYGKLLVKLMLSHTGGIPTWDHDTPSYSPEGAGLIESSCEELLTRHLDRKENKICKTAFKI